MQQPEAGEPVLERQADGLRSGRLRRRLLIDPEIERVAQILRHPDGRDRIGSARGRSTALFSCYDN